MLMPAFQFLRFFRSPISSRLSPRGVVRRRTRLEIEGLEQRALMSCNSISGFVYNDANGNGLFDAGEKPIANSSIELRNASGVVVGSTTTNANGFYQFYPDPTLDTAPSTLTCTV